MKRELNVLKAIIEADYKRHIKRFSTFKPGKETVFIGDSLIAYFPLRHFGIEDKVYQMGISGDTTQGVLDRINQVIDLAPKRIILHIGLNDELLMENDKNHTVNRLKQIINKLYQALPNVACYFVSLTPFNKDEFPKSSYIEGRSLTFAVDVNKYLKTIPKITYIDLYEQLINTNKQLIKRFSTDGIHLNKDGYQIYYHFIEDILA